MKRLRRLPPVTLVMLAVLAALVVIAAVGETLWGERASEVDLAAIAQGASGAHPFGTDQLGRDLLARTLVATRLSLVLALLTALIGYALGVSIGVLSAFLGEGGRRRLGAAISVATAFPSILVVLLVATVVGVGVRGSVIALAIALAPQSARLTHRLAIAVADSDYVAAARAAGISWWRVTTRHVLPNIAPPLAVQLSMTIGGALLAFSALSFLGLGVQEPDYDWGSLLNSGLERIYSTPLAALGPAGVIFLASVAFNVLGDTLADLLAVERAPRRRAERRRPAPQAGPAAGGVEDDDDRRAILRARGLTVTFPAAGGDVAPVRGVSLHVGPGERVGIVGESGSGKTLTARACALLVEAPGHAHAERLELDDVELAALSAADRERLLGVSLATVFQDPLTSLNPALRVGRQVIEGAQVHLGVARAAAHQRALERFLELGIGGAARRLQQYPHELSGGMRQRATIAMGLMTEPRIILADEPTTALDATVQRQVLRALRRVNDGHGTAIVLISHDISVVTAFCERVLVMYAGRVVEEIDAARIHDSAAHPYTRALLAALPSLEADRDRPLATIPGRPPRPEDVPVGCAFAPRCPHATERCRRDLPVLEPLGAGQRVACWHPQRTPVRGTQEVSSA